jgi:hypothetical protein
MPLQDAVDNSLLGLSVAFAHRSISSHHKLLCAAALACKAWNVAVQQCRACNTVITINTTAPLPWFCSFARWLPKHAPLVKSITSNDSNSCCVEYEVYGLDWQSHLEAAQQILQQALQLAAAPALVAARLSAAAVAGHSAAPPAPQQQLQGLQLVSFDSDWLVAPAVLAALPAHSLTSLNLDLDFTAAKTPVGLGVNGMAVAAALARLSSLQHLCLGSGLGFVISRDVTAACCASIAQLSQLRSLSLHGFWQHAEEPLQQLLSQPLQLQELKLELMLVRKWQSALDMTALSRLTMFSSSSWLSSGFVFPAQLQELSVWRCSSASTFAAAVAPLQQLTWLQLDATFKDVQALAQLSELEALQDLSLSYEVDQDAAITAAVTAAAWPQLSALRSPSVDFERPISSRQMAALLAGLAAATSLEHLTLSRFKVYEDGHEDEDLDWDELDAVTLPAAICGSLTGLTRLRHLSLFNSFLVLDDALALTALTGLTGLNLQGVHAGVTDVVATALACSLRQLRDLNLSACQLGDAVCLAAIGQLTQLTKLTLWAVEGVTERGLSLLTNLSCLQQLEVKTGDELTAEALDRFWAGLRSTQQ